MKKQRFIFLLIVWLCIPNLSATGLSTAKPFLPQNTSMQLDTTNIKFEWIGATDMSDEKVLYDLYFGTDTDPMLYASNLDPAVNGFSGDKAYIMEWEITINDTIHPGVLYIIFGDTLIYNTTYYWKVLAKNESGETTLSETFSFTTYNHPPSVPVLISPPNAATEVTATPTLVWSQSKDIDGGTPTYIIHLKKHGGISIILASALTDTTYTINVPLQDLTTYSWTVFAIDSITGDYSVSSTSSFTVENYKNDPPVVEKLLSPANGAINMGFSPVKFKWKASDIDNEPLRYDVYADQNNDPVTPVAQNITADSLVYLFKGYGTYYWKVIAKDSVGLTDTSSVYSFSCWEQGPDFIVEMVDVKDNNFDMGSDSIFYWTALWCDGRESHAELLPYELPKHNVSLDDYQIGKYEITNDQYCKFLNSLVNDIDNHRFEDSFQSHRQKSFPYKALNYKGKNLCLVFDMTQDLDERHGIGYERRYDSPIMWNGTGFEVDPEFLNHPVRFMYYEGASMFANWAGQYRLPTEAEWENAAMGGNQSMGYLFSGSNNYSEVAVRAYFECPPTTEKLTKPVGTLLPNELGLYDMSGNVSEICSDYFSPTYYSVSPDKNPQNTTYSNFGHVRRGGYFTLYEEAHFRTKTRMYLGYEQNIDVAGFRLAKSLGHNSVVSFTISSILGFVEYATININGKSYVSNANGQVTIENIVNGTYNYTVTALGYNSVAGSLTINDADVSEMIDLILSSYTVRFKDWDATILKEEIINYGSSIIPPSNPTRVGYTFTGWDTDLSSITNDVTITAQYTINRFTVTFLDHDGTVLKTETVEYNNPSTAPSNPYRVGYTFTGWDTDFSSITNDLTITAQYTINRFTVTFLDHDGTVLKTESVEYKNPATAPPDPTRTGQAFIGWDTDFSNVTNNLMITAQYSVVTGIYSPNADLLKIYPNPVKDKLIIETIDLTQFKNADAVIFIYNAKGEKVYQSLFSDIQLEIDVSSFPAGIYFISIGNKTKMILKE